MQSNNSTNPKFPAAFEPHLDSALFSNETIFILEENGTILLKNGLELDAELTLEQNFIDFFSPNLNHLFSAKQNFEEVFFFGKHRKWYRALGHPISIDKQPYFKLRILDITTEKEVANQLIRHKKNIEKEMLLRTREIVLTNKAMSGDSGFLQNFLRGLRHDLLSPLAQLTEIITYYKKAADGEKKERAAGLIDDCLRKLSNTSEGFSNFVDLHFIKDSDIEKLSYQDVYDSAFDLLENEVVSSKAVIKSDFLETHQDRFSHLELGSIFYNLLSNAIKFRSKERQLNINIRTSRKGKNIIFEIEDNGVGLDLEKYRTKLFKPFTRLNMEQAGAGIGLSLVRSIVEKDNRGKIELESIKTGGILARIVFINSITAGENLD